jgi:hypothetical protein
MKTDENIQLALAPAPSYSDSSTSVMTSDGAEDETIAIGTPEPRAKTIAVYADSVASTEYCTAPEGIATFDVVFNVTVTDDDGSYKTYKVVKRIGVNKAKLAAEVDNIAPVAVVEAADTKAEKNKVSIVEQFRQLAGL